MFKIISVLKALYISVTILTFLKVGWLFFLVQNPQDYAREGRIPQKTLSFGVLGTKTAVLGCIVADWCFSPAICLLVAAGVG